MKKYLFLTFIAGVLLLSCSKNESIIKAEKSNGLSAITTDPVLYY